MGRFSETFLLHPKCFSYQFNYSHNWYRPFDTPEKSTNNIWLALPAGGEAWHNNHHAFSNSAKFGLEWWQVDIGYWIINVLEKLNLVWDVKRPTAEMIAAKKVDN